MKKNINYYILFALSVSLICFSTTKSQAQTFGNEWIDYQQSYAKFSVYENGIYRISRAELVSAGITNPNGATIQIFRDGEQVPVFVSSNSGLGSNDFIEFYGRKADGKVDAPLYINPNTQMNPDQNLISDTAYYFITQSASGPHLRMTAATNSLSGAPTKENYIWGRKVYHFRGALSQGKSYIGASQSPIIYMRSSQFEAGEGWVNKFNYSSATPGAVINQVVNLPDAYKGTGAPNATLQTVVAGFSYLNNHRVIVENGGTQLADETFTGFGYSDFSMSLAVSALNNSNDATLKFTSQNSVPANNLYDRIGIAKIDARYAMSTNLNGLNSQYFELNPKTGSYYIEIDNFNSGTDAPWLYDLSSNKIYIANTAVANTLRFQIPANGQGKKLMLTGRQNSAWKAVNNLQSIAFKNHSLAANQGDYIIITDPYYYNGGGTNYVNEYKNFRSSVTGGAYTAIVADVNNVYNEFGYGYPFHAQAIRNFLAYSHKSNDWSTKSKFAFLIGKGLLYSSYRNYSVGRVATPNNYPYVPIPTFGVPASDIMLTDFDNDNIPELPIGRLSVFNGEEIGPYLDKIKLHEAAQQSSMNQYVDAVLWQKSMLHAAGAENLQQQAPILSALNRQATIAKGTNIGAFVETYAKSSSGAIQKEATEGIDRALNRGVGFIQYFGHGSASTLAFGFDIPEQYNPLDRHSFFLANGCGVGNVFSADTSRALSERWINVANKGSLGFIANSNTGFLYYLANYTDSLYKQLASYNYGNSIGEQFVGNVSRSLSNPSLLSNNVARLHAEQMLLQGDPAATMYGRPLPDYAVEEKYTKIKQLNITTQMDSFDVELVVYNLGRYDNQDSVDLIIERILPTNTSQTLLDRRMPGLAYTDTINFRVAVLGSNALGENALRIKIDNQEESTEVAEYNNEINKKFIVFNDDLEPVYPYDFSIVNDQDITLKASTLNPFLAERQYVIQIDTSELFTSALLQTGKIESAGGVVRWKPGLTYQDSVVYYWRTAMDTIYGNPSHRWTSSSFIYLPNVGPGWNQSHYYQYKKDELSNLHLSATQRNFRFTEVIKKLQVQNVCMYGPNPTRYGYADYLVKLNNSTLYTHGCAPSKQYKSLQFVIIDSLTGLPWENKLDPNNPGKGLYGSWKPCRSETTPGSGIFDDAFFEFSYNTSARRKQIMDFIDSIPTGTFIMIQPRLCLSGTCGGSNTYFIDDMMADTVTLGSGVSLYHKIKNMGFTDIDSLYRNRPMIFFQQKGFPMSTKQFVGADSSIKLYKEIDFKSYLYEGKIVSTKIGPAKQWTTFYRKGLSLDNGLIGDTISVEIYGIDHNKVETLLTTVQGDTNLSFIDANQYPCIRLAMNQKDSKYSTPEQVKYWRVHFQPVPEAALNPNAHVVCTDSVIQGQTNNLSFAIENLTPVDMDSMLVHYTLIDKNNNQTFIDSIRYKPLVGEDTIHASININTQSISGGDYFIKVVANPNDDQVEQYHPNNIGFKKMYVTGDNKNPILDVTFDGVHILNRDVVSAKPTILISLKDENQYLPLNDTTAFTLGIRYPDNPNTVIPISLQDPDVTFIPANTSNGQENKASIEYRPHFLNDGLYELEVTGKDRLDNKSGSVSYKISFEVITKSSVTSVLNYPNPFSTSTQFVFTLTGAEVPEQFKIQVYSVTGKMVREISKDEIGNIHIGRNLTEFKWRGDDQYGDLLGNGVYLYRVITRLNGDAMDQAENDPASNWTTKGFGKLYIMR